MLYCFKVFKKSLPKLAINNRALLKNKEYKSCDLLPYKKELNEK